MFIKASLLSIGFFLYLFIFWKKLKEDYIPKQIFNTGLISLLVSLGVYYLSFKYVHLWWFWLSLVTFILTLGLSVKKFGLHFFETFDASTISIMPFLGLYFLSDSIINSSIYSLVLFGQILVLVTVYIFTNGRYKSFTWYKSGKIGFAGLTTLGVFFLTRGLIAISFPFMLSFSGKFETLTCGIAAFVSFMLLYNLSRQ